MERRKFVKQCCLTSLTIPLSSTVFTACTSLYYASITEENNVIKIAKSEFEIIKKQEVKTRKFLLVNSEKFNFPISISISNEGKYTASLLKCTHRGCELIVGGGIYACPCHGSEFSMTGELLQGPAVLPLQTFKITTDDNNIYVQL